MSTSMDPKAIRVGDFWFNRPPIEWIIAPDGLDAQIKSEFGDLVEQARRGELDGWTAHPESSVALVALLDQFSRNLFRGTPEAFSADAKAREVAAKSIAQDFDMQVSVIKASAFYMPLMQDESLISLIASRCLFEALKTRCTNDEEHEHIVQLEKFGRYPSRNDILGRKSTKEEEDFLRDRVFTL
ncbi:DUF924-domain-containing protein [Karstenula rhodostoma CBS 690.94]|uniref:DUF924-domain-containing protein n=1 Tax=Karstenula rhodostoma CBS 690.94 TaxID=1392251 RepID=A0A9P4PNK1_9PLEO|nr:DUF924-domain-containing protein [Karstenula rhodostoma CBS 690.94]